MVEKKAREPKENRSEIPCLGIPSFRAEKLTEVIPVKVGSSLKKLIPRPQSAWIRRAIIERLERIHNE